MWAEFLLLRSAGGELFDHVLRVWFRVFCLDLEVFVCLCFEFFGVVVGGFV